MNLGGDKMPLFDITSEDDLLIDSQLDRASFDLRLSVAFDEHSRASNARRKEEFKSRQSLAWDSAFFTSPGILDLRELSLVNEGFKNPEDHRSKICEKARKLESGEREATESFLEYRVRGKYKLQTTKHNTREPTPNIGLASRTRMKVANQQSPRSCEMSTQKQEHRLPPCLKPSTLQTRTTGAVLSAANAKPASPRSAFQKNVSSSANKGIAFSNAGKGWLSKYLEMKGDDHKNMGDGLDLNGIDSPHKCVSGGCNVAQVSDIEGNQKPPHHENSQSEAGNKVQLPSLMKQKGAKAKRSVSPLPGVVINSSKKPSRPCMSSQRLRILEADQPASRSAKRVPLLRSISPEPRGRGTVKDYGASGGLKKGERKTIRHSLTKKVHLVSENDEKENKFCAEIESIPGGLSKEEYVDFTNLFGGLGIEPKGIKRKKASAPPLRFKAKQSNRDSAVEEAGTKSPLGARSSAFRTSAFISLV